MFESLRRIRNPFIRGLTAAAAAFSIVALTTAVGTGVAKSKDEPTYRISVYASLIAAGCGALLSAAFIRQVGEPDPTQPLSQGLKLDTSSKIWKDWRNFVVIRKLKESEEITSFYLKPEDKGNIPNFQPGQFLTIKLDIPGHPKPLIRTYSLSDYSEPCEYYRLSIKREPVPQGLDVPPGVASNFMHDQVHEGSVIQAKPPGGRFVLDAQKSLPAVLVSNGVGITPMVSMVKACIRLNPSRAVWFFHGARDRTFHAFRDEVLALVKPSEEVTQQNSNLNIHFAYSRPRPEDEGCYHSVGYVDAALIQSLVNQEAEYFLCGSPPFLQLLREGLQERGVPESRTFFESFSKGRQAVAERQPVVEPVISGEATGAEIVLAKSGKTLTWQPSDGTLLEFAEANDLNPAYSCRAGICGTCMCSIQGGEVTYLELPTAEVDEGSVLICISKPATSSVILDL